MKNFSKVVRLDKRDEPGFASSIIRLHNRHLDAKKRDPQRFWRREAVVVKNLDNGQSIVRMVLGSSGVRNLTLNAIAIDYDGMDALGLSQTAYQDDQLQIEVRKANDLDVIRYYWNHPDIGYRTAHRIAAISFAMGTIGLLLGFVPLFM